MRAAALVLRRLFHNLHSISNSTGSHLQHRRRYYSKPHLDYSNHLARARVFTFSPPCHPRRSPPPPSASLYSSLVEREAAQAAEEGEVLDMEAGTVRCVANYAPLSPISFIERAAAVYGARAALVYGERRSTWKEARDRCVRVAAALATRFGIARGDVVSALQTDTALVAVAQLASCIPLYPFVLFAHFAYRVLLARDYKPLQHKYF